MGSLIVVDPVALARHKRTLTTAADDEFVALPVPEGGGSERLCAAVEGFVSEWRVGHRRDEADHRDFVARIDGVERTCAANEDANVASIDGLFAGITAAGMAFAPNDPLRGAVE